jgi:hypothetical protein
MAPILRPIAGAGRRRGAMAIGFVPRAPGLCVRDIGIAARLVGHARPAQNSCIGSLVSDMTTNLRSAMRALADSTLALVVASIGIAMFLPPLLAETIASVLRTVVTGLVIAVAVPLHWVFLGIGAHRMGLRVVPWVALSVLLFPVGAVAALVLLGWFAHEKQAQLSTAR